MKCKINQFRMNIRFNKQHDMKLLNDKEMKYDDIETC